GDSVEVLEMVVVRSGEGGVVVVTAVGWCWWICGGGVVAWRRVIW
ncbi:hypothetical protein Tco_0506897, partial [Tanacetum coccineum]